MIKLAFQLASFCGLLFLCACSPHKAHKDTLWSKENGKIKVLTTIAMIDDLVKEIGGEDVDSVALIRGELDPHSYELVKGDDEKFARADIIFYNGLGLEHGLSLRQNLEKNPKSIAVGDSLLNNPNSLIKIGGQIDPHIWMDIALWIQTINPIVETLSQKDPFHAADYQHRGNLLREKMLKADENAYKTLQSIPQEKRYLVTSHDAFHYFTRHYLAEPLEKDSWDIRCRAPEGLAPDAQLSVTDLQSILDHIVTYKVAVVFPEANVSKDALRKILFAVKEKGLTVRMSEETLYGDSMGEESYLSMIEHNVEVIASELKGDYAESFSH